MLEHRHGSLRGVDVEPVCLRCFYAREAGVEYHPRPLLSAACSSLRVHGLRMGHMDFESPWWGWANGTDLVAPCARCCDCSDLSVMARPGTIDLDTGLARSCLAAATHACSSKPQLLHRGPAEDPAHTCCG